MIAKSDFIILLLSSSVLAFGLYNHFELRGQVNPENGTSPISSTFEKISKGGEKFVEGAAHAWQVALSKITGSESSELSAINQSRADKPVTAAMVQPQIITATAQESRQSLKPIQARTAATTKLADQSIVRVPDREAETTSNAAADATHYAAVTRIPGNATVLVISPAGNSSSDAGRRKSTPAMAQLNTQANNPGDEDLNNSLISQSTAVIMGPEKNIGSSADTTTQQAPVALPKLAEEPAVQEPAEPPIRIHQVQSGETLTRIAETLGTTVARLKEMNQLSDDRILAGQDLVYETSRF